VDNPIPVPIAVVAHQRAAFLRNVTGLPIVHAQHVDGGVMVFVTGFAGGDGKGKPLLIGCQPIAISKSS
jgi:hypothetical protein